MTTHDNLNDTLVDQLVHAYKTLRFQVENIYSNPPRIIISSDSSELQQQQQQEKMRDESDENTKHNTTTTTTTTNTALTLDRFPIAFQSEWMRYVRQWLDEFEWIETKPLNRAKLNYRALESCDTCRILNPTLYEYTIQPTVETLKLLSMTCKLDSSNNNTTTTTTQTQDTDHFHQHDTRNDKIYDDTVQHTINKRAKCGELNYQHQPTDTECREVVLLLIQFTNVEKNKLERAWRDYLAYVKQFIKRTLKQIPTPSLSSDNKEEDDSRYTSLNPDIPALPSRASVSEFILDMFASLAEKQSFREENQDVCQQQQDKIESHNTSLEKSTDTHNHCIQAEYRIDVMDHSKQPLEDTIHSDKNSKHNVSCTDTSTLSNDTSVDRVLNIIHKEDDDNEGENENEDKDKIQGVKIQWMSPIVYKAPTSLDVLKRNLDMLREEKLRVQRLKTHCKSVLKEQQNKGEDEKQCDQMYRFTKTRFKKRLKQLKKWVKRGEKRRKRAHKSDAINDALDLWYWCVHLTITDTSSSPTSLSDLDDVETETTISIPTRNGTAILSRRDWVVDDRSRKDFPSAMSLIPPPTIAHVEQQLHSALQRLCTKKSSHPNSKKYGYNDSIDSRVLPKLYNVFVVDKTTESESPQIPKILSKSDNIKGTNTTHTNNNCTIHVFRFSTGGPFTSKKKAKQEAYTTMKRIHALESSLKSDSFESPIPPFQLWTSDTSESETTHAPEDKEGEVGIDFQNTMKDYYTLICDQWARDHLQWYPQNQSMDRKSIDSVSDVEAIMERISNHNVPRVSLIPLTLPIQLLYDLFHFKSLDTWRDNMISDDNRDDDHRLENQQNIQERKYIEDSFTGVLLCQKLTNDTATNHKRHHHIVSTMDVDALDLVTQWSEQLSNIQKHNDNNSDATSRSIGDDDDDDDDDDDKNKITRTKNIQHNTMEDGFETNVTTVVQPLYWHVYDAPETLKSDENSISQRQWGYVVALFPLKSIPIDIFETSKDDNHHHSHSIDTSDESTYEYNIRNNSNGEYHPNRDTMSDSTTRAHELEHELVALLFPQQDKNKLLQYIGQLKQDLVHVIAQQLSSKTLEYFDISSTTQHDESNNVTMYIPKFEIETIKIQLAPTIPKRDNTGIHIVISKLVIVLDTRIIDQYTDHEINYVDPLFDTILDFLKQYHFNVEVVDFFIQTTQ